MTGWIRDSGHLHNVPFLTMFIIFHHAVIKKISCYRINFTKLEVSLALRLAGRWDGA